jgi:ribosomal protein L37E
MPKKFPCEAHPNGKSFGKDKLYCNDCARLAVVKRIREVKKTLVNEHGGRCSKCGYAKSMRALGFHHIDRNNKLHGLSGGSKGIKRLREEAAKCILLCANCHMELEETLQLDSETDL